MCCFESYHLQTVSTALWPSDKEGPQQLNLRLGNVNFLLVSKLFLDWTIWDRA